MKIIVRTMFGLIPPRHSIKIIFASVVWGVNPKSYAVNFNTDFLVGESQQSDLSQFLKTAQVPPGTYNADVYVNDRWKGRFDIHIKPDDQELYFNTSDILRLEIEDIPSTESITQLPVKALIHGGNSRFDVANLSVYLDVPQSYVKKNFRGYINPALWDHGIPGLVLTYNANYYHSQHKSNDQSDEDNGYISLNSGLNLFNWQLRDNSTYSHRKKEGGKWINNTRYLQRGISALNSEIQAGDSYTRSDMFESVRYRGISLRTDMRMYPDAYQSFSPVIKGIAQTNALVKIFQNNTLIHQEQVPPGAFSIDDILPTGSGGDLSVEVQEADGQVNQFTVPFSAVPNMMKAGVAKYDLNAGRTRINGIARQVSFVQGGYLYGISNLVSAYTGLIASDTYRAGLFGSSLNLPIGALSADMTHSESQFKHHNKLTGQSYKLSYSKNLQQTGTYFALAAYRYSTKNYLTFSDAISLYDRLQEGNPAYTNYQQKQSLNLNINQRLGDRYGTLYISGTLRDYWGKQSTTKEYQIGYSNNWKKINYTLSASRIKTSAMVDFEDKKEEQRYFLNLSIPLTIFSQQAYLSSHMMFNHRHYNNSNLSLNGTLGPSDNLNYSLNASNQRGGKTAGSVNISYKSAFSTLSASYSESDDFRQAGASARGSLVAYKDGILTTNQTGETFAILEAPGVKNATVNNNKSIITNKSGKVLVPYLSPYRKNALVLDTGNTPEDSSELKGNIREVTPYSGAITYLRYQTDTRRTFLVSATLSDRTPLPFGTEAKDGAGNSLGYVGQGSIIHIRAEELPSQIHISLPKQNNRKCEINAPRPLPDSQINICY